MEDLSLRQQFKINAMHGHDVGIWVCEGSGLSLSPCLFMQAVCPTPPPRSLLAKWKPANTPPKSFRKSGASPLIYSECGRLPPWPYHVHLFAPQEPIARAFEQESGLQDWSLAVPVVGIIVIFDKKHDGPPSVLSADRLWGRSLKPNTNRTLAWACDQRVPIVVAALGYDDAPDATQQLRQRYDITSDIAIVPGPALTDARRRNEQDQGGQASGMFSSVFEHQKLALDQDHARAILGKLFQSIERER